MKPKLRKAKVGEENILQQIASASEIFVYPKILYKYLITKSAVTAITLAEQIVGYISYTLLPKIKAMYVLQIAFKPEYQGQNLGTSSLNRLINFWKRKFKVETIWLHTIKKRVHKWMINRGFTDILNLGGQLWVLSKPIS